MQTLLICPYLDILIVYLKEDTLFPMLFILCVQALQIFSPIPLTDIDNVIIKSDLTTIKVIDDKREIHLKPDDVHTLQALLATLRNYKQPPKNLASIINNFTDTVDIDAIIAQGNTSFLVVFSDQPVEAVDSIHVYYSTDYELAETLKVPFPGIYGYNAKERHQYRLKTTDIASAVSIVHMPLFREITTSNIREYDTTLQPKFFVFYINALDDETLYRNVARKYAERAKVGKILHTGGNSLHNFGIADESLPAVIMVQGKTKYKCESLTPHKLDTFINDFLSNTLQEFLLSGPEPENNGAMAVKTLTADNLATFLEHDVLVVFTSPQCRYCKLLKPVIDDLSTRVRHPNIVIGNYDASVNDISGVYEVKGFPTVYLLSEGRRVAFEGDRTVEVFVAFIEKYGRYKGITEEYVEREDL